MSQLNTSIPFAGYVPNFANALASGSQAAAMRNEASRQNALATAMQTHGAGLINGDQQAMNALAVFDPAMVMNVQDTRQGMDARALQMDATRQDMRIQAEQWAAQLDAQEAAAAAEGLTRALLMMEDAVTPQQWDAMAQQLGKPELVGQFALREQRLMEVLPFADAVARRTQQAQARQERKTDSKAATEFNPDRYRNVEGIGLVDLQAPGGPQPVQFPGQAGTPAPSFDDVTALRKEIGNDPAVRNFIQMSSAFNRIQASANAPQTGEGRAAADVALIFGFMRMLDPASVVREGEFATAQRTAGIPDRVWQAFEQVQNGNLLTDQQRAEFLNQARSLYEGQRDQYKGVVNDYAEIARRNNFPLEDVFIDYGAGNQSAPIQPPPPPGDTPTGTPTPEIAPPPGPQPTLPPIPVPDQISTWTKDNLTAFLEANAQAGRILPPEVWDAIMARSMQLNQQVQQ